MLPLLQIAEPDTAGLSKTMQYMLAVLLILLMTGLGATLTMGQVYRVAKHPRSILIGWASQFGWMPIIAVVFCFIFSWTGAGVTTVTSESSLTALRSDYDTVMAVYNATGNSAHLKLNRTCVGSECVRLPKSE